MYCSVENIIDRLDDAILIQLTDDDGSGNIVEDVITGAITDAGSIADGYLSRRYPTPLTSVPDSLRIIVSDLAVCRLYLRRHSVPDHIQRADDAAISFLKMISRGDADLFPAGSSTRASSKPVMYSDEPVFSRSKMGGF
jgi:phage gp36-like protein